MAILEMSLLDHLGLSDAQKRDRMGSIGGSDANIIMGDKPDRIHRLWEEKTGKRESDDLSDVLAVVMGQYTEDLNAAWYEKQTGDKVTDRGAVYKLSDGSSVKHATIDGLCLDRSAIWEAKHVGGFETIDTVVQRYMPQLHHNAHVCNGGIAVLSVFIGNSKWEQFKIEIDPFYLAALLEAEEKFWKCVTSDTPPGGVLSTVAPPALDEMREVDMTGSNEWAAYADDYITNRVAAKVFDKAKDGLKKLVEPDVRLAKGHGLCITRSKSGSLLFKEE